MALSKERFEIRLWQEGDEEALARLANNHRIWRNLTNRFPHPYEHADAVAWVAGANLQPENAQHFAIVVDDEVFGSVGFERLQDLHTRTAEIGYWIGEPFWGRGIATRALTAATTLAFEDFDFVRLQAGVLEWNPASCRVLEKVGYTLEGRLKKQVYKDGEVCDKFLYALIREDRPHPDRHPV
jgi:ribosomal-protein-alanine N-acetyltransferase